MEEQTRASGAGARGAALTAVQGTSGAHLATPAHHKHACFWSRGCAPHFLRPHGRHPPCAGFGAVAPTPASWRAACSRPRAMGITPPIPAAQNPQPPTDVRSTTGCGKKTSTHAKREGGRYCCNARCVQQTRSRPTPTDNTHRHARRKGYLSRARQKGAGLHRLDVGTQLTLRRTSVGNWSSSLDTTLYRDRRFELRYLSARISIGYRDQYSISSIFSRVGARFQAVRPPF